MKQNKIQSQARACALAVHEILWQSLVCGRPADRCLAGFLRANRQFGSRDRRLLSETVFACLRWWGWLRPLAPKPFRTSNAASAQDNPGDPPPIHPAAWSAVLAGAHLLEGGPFPAAVREWFEQARVRDDRNQRGTADRSLPTKAMGLQKAFPNVFTEAPDMTQLIPPWAPQAWSCPRGPAELLGWIQSRPPIWLRLQTADSASVTQELTAAGLDVQPHPVLTKAVALKEARVNLRTLESFKKGRFEVQDLASQTVGLICAPAPGERWWDACAGAGGKALHLADLMLRKGSVTASDIRTYKLKDLKLRARRAGFPNIRTREWKGKALPEKKGGFDGVLVDTPCSCSGTWRRNPDARWTTRREDLNEFAELQGQLLENAAGAVNPGGTLVYATCSMFDCENRDVVETFLKSNSNVALDPFVNPITGEHTDGMLQIWPWDGNCDAMFVARMRARGH